VAGEQLPPVVASLEGDDTSFLDMLDRDVAAIRSAASEIEGILASLDIGAGLADSLSGADLGSLNTDEITQGLAEAMGGAGAAIAQDIGTELASEVATAGAEAGTALGEAVAEGAAGTGDTVGQELASELAPASAAAGARAGAALAEGLESTAAGAGQQAATQLSSTITAGTADLGDRLAAQISDQLRQGLDGQAQATMAMLAAVLAAGAAGTGALAGRVAAAALGAALSTQGADVAAQAGASIGDGLAAGIGAGASGAGAGAATQVAEAIEAPLADALIQAGSAAGDALAIGISAGAADGADGLAQLISDSVQAPLESAMTQAGMAAGDALNAGIEAVAAEGGATFVTEFESGAESRAEEAGAQAGAAWGAGFGSAALRGVDLIESGLSTAGIPIDPAARAEAAAAAAAAQEAEEIAAAMDADDKFLQEGIDNFLQLGGLALSEWLEQVQLASESAKDAFISVYEAVQAQLDATTALTDEQQSALDLMYFRASTEMSALQEEANALNEAINAAAAGNHGFGSIQGVDLVAGNLSTAGEKMKSGAGSEVAGAVEDAGAMAGELDGVATAAEGATAGVGGLASVMSGPLGMAVFAAMSFLPMLGGAFRGLGDALNPTKAQLLDVQQLQQAIGGDGGTAGMTTAAFVATSSAANGLAGQAEQAGVSLETWTEAAMGNSAAQQAVTDSIGKLNQAQLNQKVSSDDAGSASSHAALDLKGAQEATDSASASTNRYTDANQKLINSMYAEAGQVADTVRSTQAQDQATMQLAMNTQIFSATLDGAFTKMQMSAQQNSESTVALLNLGDSQSGLNMQLYNSVNAYNVASQQASGYASVLQALSGAANTLYGAEASFEGALVGLTASMKQNGDSLDANSAKGYQNAQAVKQVADAANQAAVAVYQSDVQNGNASKAYEDATTKLDSEKDAFEQAAIKAGANKTAVQQLANELFQLPKNITSNVNVNVHESMSLTELNDKLNSPQLRASGGPVDANNAYIVGERGPELVTFGADGYVTPNYALRSAMGEAGSGSGGSSTNVTVIVQGSLIHQDDLTDSLQTGALQFQNRNGYTGLVGSH
jgi:hypothetical protein